MYILVNIPYWQEMNNHFNFYIEYVLLLHSIVYNNYQAFLLGIISVT